MLVTYFISSAVLLQPCACKFMHACMCLQLLAWSTHLQVHWPKELVTFS
jgi:hypothetical protein